jgi:serine/threonine protein kinase
MPPWCRPDLGHDVLFKEIGDSLRLYVDDADINLEDYTTVREIIRIPSSVILVLNEALVLKMRLATFDIEAIVNFMRLASTVVPVPHIYKYGHSGNCSFVLMEYIQGHNLAFIKRSLRSSWISVMATVEKQVEAAVQRLAYVGLSHHDLYPRNILINDSWEIVGIVDWDYCTPFNPAQEYLRGLDSHLSQVGMSDSEVFDPWHWNPIFLKQVNDRLSLVNLNEGWSFICHNPFFLRFPRRPVDFIPGNPHHSKPRLVTQMTGMRRIAVMTSNTGSFVHLISILSLD